MASAPAIITTDPTPEQWRRWSEATGRRPRITTGTHIDNLAATRKAVWLCWSGCQQKFDPKPYGYIEAPDAPTVRGRCDGCRENSRSMRMFVHRSQACTL